jgi:hypothetical protein
MTPSAHASKKRRKSYINNLLIGTSYCNVNEYIIRNCVHMHAYIIIR